LLRFGVQFGLLSVGLLSRERLLPGVATVVHAVWRDVPGLHFRVLHCTNTGLSDNVRVWISLFGDHDGPAGLWNADACSVDDTSSTGAVKPRRAAATD
jgi:hypothetical protein